MKYVLLSRQVVLPCMLLAMVWLIAAGWLYQSLDMVDIAQMRQQQAQAKLATVEQKIMQSAENGQWIASYINDYHQLQRRGFIGGDQRLAWSQALLLASARLGMRDVSFDIGPQQQHQPVLAGGTYRLLDTPVQFTAQIPHEGIFAQFLEALRKQNEGIFTVRECTLLYVKATAPLQARCIFEWHTWAAGSVS